MFSALVACGGEQAIAPLGRQAKKLTRPLPAKRVTTASSHQVRSGESLYAIAWIYNLDYRDIATRNAIAEPYTIYPGQRLVLPPSGPITGPPRVVKPKPQASTSSARKIDHPPPRSPSKVRAKRPTKTVTQSANHSVKKITHYAGATVKDWRWPAKGKVIGRFNKSGGKGINIQGRRGQPVYTAAPGRVVYSGSGLRGYGKLIIIKHNKRFLSAYAHNQRLQVREGDSVKSGQQIAEMGDTESREIKLHFEIRRDGKPVNPIRHLP